MLKADRTRLRALVRNFEWERARSAAYADAPHRYVIFYRSNKVKWRWFEKKIREHGVYRTWRGHRYKYLILDRYAYWVDWPALNRAQVSTLDPLL